MTALVIGQYPQLNTIQFNLFSYKYACLICFTDNENPVISDLPDDITQNTDSELSTAVVSWTEPTASDNAGSVTLTSSHNSGDMFSIGNTTVTYTATDESPNTAVAMFTVEIEGMLTENVFVLI